MHKPPPRTRLTGAEPFHTAGVPLDRTVLDFWKWSTSALLENRLRSLVAEYLVSTALGLREDSRIEWAAYDLITDSGITIEVKSAAYVQAWAQHEDSSISFGIQPTRGWNPETAESGTESKRQAQLYVFAIFEQRDRAAIDVLDVSQWSFLVLPSRVLDERCALQKTISLSSLMKLGPTQAKFHEIRQAVTTLAP